ncbi:MAG: hypothetical protein IKM54_00460 [Butyricicoccus sp.]|nr:hypothetical protein [Butyricicoccus sp.]
MRKLLKYEMRAMNRRLFPVYIGMLAIALLNYLFGFGLILRGSDSLVMEWTETLPDFLYILISTMQAVITALFFGLLVGMMVVWLITTIDRFRKGLLGREGYLMFTLPVTTGRLIGAKLLAASIHLVLSGLVALLSFCIIMDIPSLITLLMEVGLPEIFRQLSHAVPTWPLLVLETILLGILSVFRGILQFYLALALGHLSNRHRTLMSVLAYIGISAALSMLASLFFSGLAVLEMSGLIDGLVQLFTRDPQIAAHIMSLIFSMLTILQCVIFWFPTRYILNNHLNLE